MCNVNECGKQVCKVGEQVCLQSCLQVYHVRMQLIHLSVKDNYTILTIGFCMCKVFGWKSRGKNTYNLFTFFSLVALTFRYFFSLLLLLNQHLRKICYLKFFWRDSILSIWGCTTFTWEIIHDINSTSLIPKMHI